MGAPLFKKATLMLENGKTITINAPANSATNKYIQEVKENGLVTTKNWLSHEKLMKRTVIDIKMSTEPNKKRGINEADAPFLFPK